MKQPDLFGGLTGGPPTPPAYPAGKDRLLFAVYPETATADLIVRRRTDLRLAQGLDGPSPLTDMLHLSLRHVGDVIGPPPAMVDALTTALADFSFRNFEITLDGLTSFGAKAGPLVLTASPEGNPDLMDFRRALCARLDEAGAGWREDGANFAPHVTLSYERQAVAAQPIEPIRWTAREFALIHSPLDEMRHLRLARFALA